MSDSVIRRDIPKDAQNIVVFVHGFGVRWDSRGMFVDIKESLPKTWGTILFDLSDVNGIDVYISPISQQIEKLRHVITDVKEKDSNAKIHIIAHSMGCIITALLKPEITGKILLLAPPESFGLNLQTYFENYPGAIKIDTEIVVPRKDGTRTHIPLGYFVESQKLNAQAEMKRLSERHPYILVQTTKDEVIGDTTYDKLQHNKNINIFQLSSDHNFTGNNRKKLLSLIRENLR